MLPPRRHYTLSLPRERSLSLGGQCLVMGILNVTPDSFAERAPFQDAQEAADAGLAMEAAGADVIDVGGESTRPGALPVDLEEELARVIPVVRQLVAKARIPVSIDTSKAVVARRALDAGASIVNDVSGLRHDADMARAVAASGAALIVMHMRGRPDTMHEHAQYGNFAQEIEQELRASVDLAIAAGISRDRLMIDPGIGFAKRAADSYGVFARIHPLAQALDLPVMVGPSRKSFMRDALNGRPAVERDWGTAAAVAASVLAGAHMVRVHAVAEMVQVVRVAEGIRSAWTV